MQAQQQDERQLLVDAIRAGSHYRIYLRSSGSRDPLGCTTLSSDIQRSRHQRRKITARPITMMAIPNQRIVATRPGSGSWARIVIKVEVSAGDTSAVAVKMRADMPQGYRNRWSGSPTGPAAARHLERRMKIHLRNPTPSVPMPHRRSDYGDTLFTPRGEAR